MHVQELQTSMTDLRVGAIHRRNPLHTFMFNSDGVLLNGNMAALEAFQQTHIGDDWAEYGAKYACRQGSIHSRTAAVRKRNGQDSKTCLPTGCRICHEALCCLLPACILQVQ